MMMRRSQRIESVITIPLVPWMVTLLCNSNKALLNRFLYGLYTTFLLMYYFCVVPTLSYVLMSTLCMVGLSTFSLVLSTMHPIVLYTTLYFTTITITTIATILLLFVLFVTLPATRDRSNQTETETKCNVFHGGWA